MFSSPELHTNMTCHLKIDTQSPGWYKTINKVLRKINGVNYWIDAENGMAYITGRVKPNKLLKKIAKANKHIETCWVEAGNQKTFSDGYGNYTHLMLQRTPPPYPPQYYPPLHSCYGYGSYM